MLILLFLFALFRRLQGSPLAANDGGSIIDNFPTLYILPRADVIFGTRSTSDIVISCLATIFACTWTAIHPNIPSLADSRWNIFKRRLVTTVYALLIPEYISLWAWRQYLGAKRIMKDYNSIIAKQAKHQHQPPVKWYRKSCFGFTEWFFCSPPFYPRNNGEPQEWTITHGFFVQKGGFVLSRNGMPTQAMSFSESWIKEHKYSGKIANILRHEKQPSNGIKESILYGLIDVPKITEAEIEDRSKGDIISKTVVILQTTWFIAQCIARWSTGIPVTELEVITLGFAMLNGITYALWWHKPQNVGVPVYLEAKAPLSINSLNHNTPIVASNPKTESGIELPQINREKTSSNQIPGKLEHLVPIEELDDAKLHKPSQFVRKLGEKWNSSTPIKFLMVSIPSQLILGVLHPLDKLSEARSDYVHQGDLRVPMFFAELVSNVNNIIYFIDYAAMLFGCVHLVPSFFLHYPSPMEMRLWQISAAFITIQPLYTMVGMYVDNKIGSSLPKMIKIIFSLLAVVSYPLYIVARLTLIILCFLSLHNLPENTHQTIDWISSIPHL